MKYLVLGSEGQIGAELCQYLRNQQHEVIEFDFPDELDKDEPKHDFIFIRDSFITDQNGTAVILRAGEPQRRVENKTVKIYLILYVLDNIYYLLCIIKDDSSESKQVKFSKVVQVLF